MSFEQIEWLYKLCIDNGLKTTIEQIEQLKRYADLLLEWNKKLNLISRRDEEKIWTYHILHSISPLFKVNIPYNSNVVDIGTGGGLPGIPIKIMRPDISVLCIDSTGKKTKALSQISAQLELQDTEIVWGRVEELGLQIEYNRRFDIALARAVAPLCDLAIWASGLLKNRSMPVKVTEENDNAYLNIDPPVLLAYKGGDITKEVEITKRKCNHLIIRSVDLVIPGAEKFITSDKKLLVVHSG